MNIPRPSLMNHENSNTTNNKLGYVLYLCYHQPYILLYYVVFHQNLPTMVRVNL